jgi:hypothetical protein
MNSGSRIYNETIANRADWRSLALGADVNPDVLEKGVSRSCFTSLGASPAQVRDDSCTHPRSYNQ